MKTARLALGTGLVIAGGLIAYDLAVSYGLIGQTLPLLLLLAAQVLFGGLAGQLMRSWRAVALGPAAFVVGFLAGGSLQSTGWMPNAPESGAESGTAIGALAGGSFILGVAFVLVLLCALLAIGIAIGATRGIRRQRRPQTHRTHMHRIHTVPLEEALADLNHIEQFVTSDTPAPEPTLRDLIRV